MKIQEIIASASALMMVLSKVETANGACADNCLDCDQDGCVERSPFCRFVHEDQACGNVQNIRQAIDADNYFCSLISGSAACESETYSEDNDLGNSGDQRCTYDSTARTCYSSYDLTDLCEACDASCEEENCNYIKTCEMRRTCRDADETEAYTNLYEQCTGINNEPTCTATPGCSYRGGSCKTTELGPDVCETRCSACGTKKLCGTSILECVWNAGTTTCENCEESCAACKNRPDCAASEQTCLFDDEDGCRKMTEYEVWEADKETCELAGGREGCAMYDDICTFSDGTCAVTRAEPKICENDCGSCETSTECSASPIGCSYVDDECQACDDECGFCETESFCEGSEQRCLFESNSCREMTEYEMWVTDVEYCGSASEEDCDASKWCQYDKKAGVCEVKRNAPKVCELECGECDDSSTCGDSPAGCMFSDDECMSCDEGCGYCSSEELCTGSDYGCVYENQECREQTDLERYYAAKELCESLDLDACFLERDLCQIDRPNDQCLTKVEPPKVCEILCGECDEESPCNDSPAACSWDGEEEECVSCDDSCGACSGSEECAASNAICSFENNICRELNELEIYQRSEARCASYDEDQCGENKGECKYNKQSGVCATKLKAPKVCALDCKYCDEETCDDSEAACTFMDGKCKSCHDDCGACADSSECSASENNCKFDNDVCREKTDLEEYLDGVANCEPKDEDACGEDRANCKWDRGSSTCLAKAKAPKVCETTCGECEDQESCEASPATCGFFADENRDKCQACSENCLACASQSDCEANDHCTFENRACRALSEYELYLAEMAKCDVDTEDECKDLRADGCKYDSKLGSCVSRSKAPKVCEVDCKYCDDESECSSSPATCAFFPDEKRDQCQSCDGRCDACGSSSDCSGSANGCVFESNVCRDMTDLEKYQADNAKCDVDTEDECKLLRSSNCKFDRKLGVCTTKTKAPKVCEIFCDECDSDSTCNSQSNCNWHVEEEECLDCREDCAGCSSRNECNAQALCTFDSGCREKTDLELYEEAADYCQTLPDRETCVSNENKQLCKWDRAQEPEACATKLKLPKVCDNTCKECDEESECNGSSASCSWDGRRCQEGRRLR